MLGVDSDHTYKDISRLRACHVLGRVPWSKFLDKFTKLSFSSLPQDSGMVPCSSLPSKLILYKGCIPPHSPCKRPVILLFCKATSLRLARSAQANGSPPDKLLPPRLMVSSRGSDLHFSGNLPVMLLSSSDLPRSTAASSPCVHLYFPILLVHQATHKNHLAFLLQLTVHNHPPHSAHSTIIYNSSTHARRRIQIPGASTHIILKSVSFDSAFESVPVSPFPSKWISSILPDIEQVTPSQPEEPPGPQTGPAFLHWLKKSPDASLRVLANSSSAGPAPVQFTSYSELLPLTAVLTQVGASTRSTAPILFRKLQCLTATWKC